MPWRYPSSLGTVPIVAGMVVEDLLHQIADMLIYIFLPTTKAHGQEETIFFTVVAFNNAMLSLIGSCFIIGGFVILRQLNIFGNRLVLYLSITDGLYASTYLLILVRLLLTVVYPSAVPIICTLEGFFKQLFLTSSITWIACIATNLVIAVGIGWRHSNRLEFPYILVATVFPALNASFLLLTQSYGVAGPWCWIKGNLCGICVLSHPQCLVDTLQDPLRLLPAAPPHFSNASGILQWWLDLCWPNGILGRLFLFYFFLFAVMVYDSLVYGSIGLKVYISYKRLGPVSASAGVAKQRRIFRRLSLFVLSFIVIWTPSTCYRLFQLIFPGYRLVWLEFLHTFCAPLNGFVNALVYGWNERFVQRLFEKCGPKDDSKKLAPPEPRSLRARRESVLDDIKDILEHTEHTNPMHGIDVVLEEENDKEL
jgi:hypothetical protein